MQVSNEYGTLLDADALYGLSDGRRKKVDWSKEVQPVQLRIGLLRAVKDKLPKGVSPVHMDVLFGVALVLPFCLCYVM